jgi:Fe-S cluster assembly protein SufD
VNATAEQLTARIAGEHAAALNALPATAAGLEHRRAALAAFTAQGLPTHRDENWRYASLHGLHHARFTPAIASTVASTIAGGAPDASPDVSDSAVAAALPPPIEGYARYTFVDGRFAPRLSRTPPHPALQVLAAADLPMIAGMPTDEAALADTRLALLNQAFATDGARIVAAGERPACVEVIFVASAPAQAGASYPRLHVAAQPGSRLGLIERHISSGSGESFINGAITVDVDRGATLDHYRLQHTGAQTLWMDTLSARVQADGVYRLHLAHLGGQSARSTLQISLAGERASVLLNTVSVAAQLQVHDTLAVIEHAAADTRTEQRFRGIAAGQAHVAFNGKVVVREDARGAFSRQSLRGLLAGERAEMNVRPQLEIYTDDVQCSHGATTGKLDENMLFYLLSRGLEPDTAQLLLKWAFLEDVVARIDQPALRGQIERALAGQMGAAALQELL